ncbi:MAG: ABC transporter ATP-binding protein [Acetatifactor sp.]|nr:ABC transporter ATP-binding protein [Acetatifactor sp.]
MEAKQIRVREIDVPAIEVKDVVKIYKLYDKPKDRLKEALGLGRKQVHKLHYALNGVSLCINRGETVGIIGTNGSGKSTILKIITGVLHPTSGEVRVDGRISALLELGAGFNQEYNGIENVYLNGTMMGFSEKEIDAKLPEILEFADIGAYVHQPVKTYSSGMFVRLAFAVAINIEPEILIVDEALSVGDVFFQAKCYHKFEEFKKLGKTIVFVSHDLSSISKYCDRVYLLNKGTLLGEGTPKAMIDAYKRVLVGQYEMPEQSEEGNLLHDKELRQAAGRAMGAAGERTDDPVINPDLLEYGTKQAEIAEFYLTDDRGVRTTAVIKGSEFTLHMRVRFHQYIPAPIFAFSFKNVRGTEITGTNSMIEKAFLESVEPGQVKDVTFTQKMSLQGGEYLLSMGVTGYNGDTFEVYHRLYDAMNITVVSDKDTVGYYDMDSLVSVVDATERFDSL